jgi:hypothetical protein
MVITGTCGVMVTALETYSKGQRFDPRFRLIDTCLLNVPWRMKT